MTIPVVTAGMRCAARSLRLGEDPIGTASTVRAFLLLEHGGPWGVSAARDAPLPRPVAEALQAAYSELGVRPLLVRRHRELPGVPKRPRVVVAACDPDGGRAAARVLDHVGQAADLPLADLLSGLRSPDPLAGWDEVDRLFLTCTHGRHDVCCAERGRPVAAVMDRLAGDAAWEASHIGGDRFAANVLILPEGLYYGRVPVERVPELIAAHDNDRCVPDLLRGRASLSFAVQATEVALRRHLDVAELSALQLIAVSRTGCRTTASWRVAGRGSWGVIVDVSHPGPPRALTCSTQPVAPPVYTVVGLTETQASDR